MVEAIKKARDARVDAGESKGELSKLTPEMREKKALLDRLDPALWGLFQQFREHQRSERVSTIRGRYEQGRILLLADKSHRRGLEAVGRAAGLSNAVMAELQLVARRITAAEVAAFVGAADGAAAGGMGWAHLAALAVIEDSQARMRYIHRAAKEGLTVEQLRQAVQEGGVKRYEGGKREGGGRHWKLPSNPIGVFDRIKKQTDPYLRLLDQAAGDELRVLVMETPPDQIGPGGLAKIRDTRDSLGRLYDDLAGKLAMIDALIDEVGPSCEAIVAPADAPAAIGGPVPMPPPAMLPESRPPSPAVLA